MGFTARVALLAAAFLQGCAAVEISAWMTGSSLATTRSRRLRRNGRLRLGRDGAAMLRALGDALASPGLAV
jgi:hypothetical protein